MNAPDESNISTIVSTNNSNFASFLKDKILKKHWQPPLNIFYQELDYTNCTAVTNSTMCIELLKIKKLCKCELTLKLPKKFTHELRMYYKIDNMYQNHRIYAESFDFYQQIGFKPSQAASTSCGTLAQSKGQIIDPCGLVPNSLFNDTFTFWNGNTEIPLITSWIVSKTARKIFKNPEGSSLEEIFKDTEKPPNWLKPIYQLDIDNSNNNGFLNNRYINWMNIYPFPGVLKPIGSIVPETTPETTTNIRIIIQYSNIDYRVDEFDGKKKIIFVQESILGLPNPELGYIFCVFSIVSLIFVIYFWLYSNFSQSSI
ncbi:hypothetical protein MXB_5122 [Myxobolus squamalis]|nr:hypothetical protein MXB_5122 [Myxobolus squamalis]